MKRVFDCITAISALLLLSSILIIIIILIFTTSGRPIFFVQSRIGRYGKAFSMIKFRTMSLSQVSDSTISIKGDVRITKIGMFLRKYKFDELPELWNILVGDMSLVGPRPDVPGYADRLEGEDMLILDLRPGITGPASLKYVNEEEVLALQDDPVKYNDDVIYPDKVRLNLDYYYNNNLWLDIKIIFATIFRTSY